MYQLRLCPTGTVDVAVSHHDTLADAHHALARVARGYDIQGYGTNNGTLTTRTGRVNQASYTWRITAVNA